MGRGGKAEKGGETENRSLGENTKPQSFPGLRLEHSVKRNHEMPEMQLPGGSDLLSSGGDPSPATTAPPRSSSPRRKPVNIVDLNLNDEPPESDGEDGMLPPTPVDPSARSFSVFLSTDIICRNAPLK
jgi:hypothetical protein